VPNKLRNYLDLNTIYIITKAIAAYTAGTIQLFDKKIDTRKPGIRKIASR